MVQVSITRSSCSAQAPESCPDVLQKLTSEVPDGQALAPGAQLGDTQRRERMLPPYGPTTCKEDHQIQAPCKLGSRQGKVPDHAESWQHKLALN